MSDIESALTKKREFSVVKFTMVGYNAYYLQEVLGKCIWQ